MTTINEQVTQILRRHRVTEEEFKLLLSEEGTACLEEMAVAARRVTLQHFGRSVLLFTPLYLSDHCVNTCTYCSFSFDNQFDRKQLSLTQVAAEGERIAQEGLRHVLLVTGESVKHADLAYLSACVQLLRERFASVSIEIQPLSLDGYREMINSGVDGLTLYQETYNEARYREVHLKGPKRNYRYRLEAPERACQAGMRVVTIGVLLGLYENWREDVYHAAMHARRLQLQYPSTEIGLSFPRLRPHLGSWQSGCTVSDQDLVQAMLAVRLFLPRAGITLSTREPESLRNHLVQLGVTKMSAGSSTAVGGYTGVEEQAGTPQFAIADERSVTEVAAYLQNKGIQPVFKDWM